MEPIFIKRQGSYFQLANITRFQIDYTPIEPYYPKGRYWIDTGGKTYCFEIDDLGKRLEKYFESKVSEI